MKWIDYREKLGIGFEDDKKLELLRNKILAFLPTVAPLYTDESYRNYIIMVCEEVFDYSISGIEYSFNLCKTTIELVSKYIAFVNTFKKWSPYDLAGEISVQFYPRKTPEEMRKTLLDFLQDSLEDLNIPHELIEDSDGYFIFPKGIKEFDAALVSEVLDWLKDYPTAEKAWSKALREYSEGKAQNASDVADMLRKALEEFFKEFFGNGKVLINNKPAYGSYLKSQGIPTELSNNFETLLQAYDSYMNGYAKHGDKTEAVALEYLLYQTGNIIRFLITLKKNETAS